MAIGAWVTSGCAPLLNSKTRLTELPGRSVSVRPETTSCSASPGRNATVLGGPSSIRAGREGPAGAKEAPGVGAGDGCSDGGETDCDSPLSVSGVAAGRLPDGSGGSDAAALELGLPNRPTDEPET